MTLPLSNEFPDGGRSGAVEELVAHATVNGTTVMGTYEVKGGTVLLTSADFGDASAGLDGQAPEDVAARLLRDMAEEAMARSGEYFMRDDEVNAPETPGA